MSFPKYPKYKESGVEWLGDVPAHWNVVPCRAIATERTSKNEGAQCSAYLSLMANVGIIPYEEKGDIGNKKPEDLSKCKLVARGDFVINSMNYGIGSYGISGYDGVCSPVYIVLTPQVDVVEPRFAFRIFENRAFQTLAQSFGNGILEHRCAINWDILKGIRVAIPPKEEQCAILTLLDRETSKIDELVAEQKRLIELLKEKRQAVISHAVTKGLNRHASMEPSGIEWLGDVPSHWEVSRFGQLSNVVRGGSPRPAGDTSLFNGDYSPWVTVAEITKDEEIDLTATASFLTEKGSQQSRLFPKGTLLLTNSGGSLGVPKMLQIDANANDGVIGFLNLSLNHHFAYFYLSTLTEYLRETVRRTGGSTQINLNTHLIKQLAVPVPPKGEVEEITKLIFELRHGYRALEKEAERAIELLLERRSSLISAAVTGKIDVRGLLKTEAA